MQRKVVWQSINDKCHPSGREVTSGKSTAEIQHEQKSFVPHQRLPSWQIAIESQKNNIRAASWNVALMLFWWLSTCICWQGTLSKHVKNEQNARRTMFKNRFQSYSFLKKALQISRLKSLQGESYTYTNLTYQF